MSLVGCKEFFKDWSNTVDFVLCVLILAFWIYCFILTKTLELYIDEVIETTFYVIWFIWQYKRIITLFAKVAEANDKNNDKLNFSQITEENDLPPNRNVLSPA